MQPLISVLVPVYNTLEFLPACLDSVLAQTYANIEVLLLDDGSTDGSGAICDEYAAKDSRVAVYHQANAGVASARNALITKAKGEYVAWVDSDDLCAPEMLEKLYAIADTYGADIAQCGYTNSYARYLRFRSQPVKDGDTTVSSSFEEALISGAFSFCMTTKLMKRSLFDGLLFPPITVCEDAYMFNCMIERVHTYALTDSVYYYYRNRKGSLTHSTITADSFTAYLAFLSIIPERTPMYEQVLFQYCHFIAKGLHSDVTKYHAYKEQIDDCFARLRLYKRDELTSKYIGKLGRMEVRALCTGKRWSWHFAVLCQKIYGIHQEWKQG